MNVPVKSSLSDSEKKQILKDILGASHSSTGQHFQLYSKVMDYHGNVHDVLSFAELLPATSSFLSGSLVSGIISTSSFVGILLFPVTQLVNLINANETGQRAYSYRSIAYTITAWTYDRPVPNKSSQILHNLTNGIYVGNQNTVKAYNSEWQKTSQKVFVYLKQECIKKNIPESHLKIIFKALGGDTPEKMCTTLLAGFENKFSGIPKKVWKSNYKITFPR